MENKYNQWYWRIYRWFKWEAKFIPRRFVVGIKNNRKWFPIIWKDRDYDHYFILEILKFKLHNVADRIDNTNRFVDSVSQVRDIRICERLIQKLQDSYYIDEMHAYWETKMRTEPIENSTKYTLEFDDIRDDMHIYLSKYPNDVRRALKSRYLKDRENPSNKQIGIAVSYLREQRAKTLLFKIMDRKIMSWWD
jgi:ribosomal protein S8